MFTKVIRSRVATYLAVAVAGILIGAGGVAVAAPSGGVLHACAGKTTGLLRLASRCTKRERAVTWNVQGRQGTQGERGQQGMQGVQGIQGARGDKGDAGPPGPTEGTAADYYTNHGGNPTVDETDDPSPFTTTQAGPVFVSKSIDSISASCNVSTNVEFVLVVDGTRVPGSIIDVPNGTTVAGATLTGVTPTALPAGTHTASIGVACGGNGVSGESSTVGQAVTAVVLG